MSRMRAPVFCLLRAPAVAQSAPGPRLHQHLSVRREVAATAYQTSPAAQPFALVDATGEPFQMLPTHQKTSHPASMVLLAVQCAEPQYRRLPFLRDARRPGRLHQRRGAGLLSHTPSAHDQDGAPDRDSKARSHLPDANRITVVARIPVAIPLSENVMLPGSGGESFEPELQSFPPERDTRAAISADTHAEYGPLNARPEMSSRPDQRNCRLFLWN